MKVNNETKKAVAIVLGVGLACVIASLTSGCGKVGPMGPQGLQGLPGNQGPQGPAGSNGTNCVVTQIDTGATITCGTNTATITNGVQGNAGQNAQPCTTITVSNGVELDCPGSSPVIITNGTNGVNGVNGVNGTNGTNGSTITMVQFCNGTASYPSTFPEIGFCINNNLYGVYSANGGFMAYLPPGEYSSDGINDSCDFTIEPNCVVSNN